MAEGSESELEELAASNPDGEFLTEFVPLQSDEEVLSDIHVNCNSSQLDTLHLKAVSSRFVFEIPEPLRKKILMDEDAIGRGKCTAEKCEGSDDEDSRIQRPEVLREVIHIEHTMATVLEQVGTQVWRGALYLCDFILANPSIFANCNTLELGAGVGLVSILLNYIGTCHTFCTDHLEEVLSLCQRNTERNWQLSHIWKNRLSSTIQVRYLNWFAKHFPEDFPAFPATDKRFSWTSEDLEILRTGFSIVAADVIYSDSLTDAFLSTLFILCETFQMQLVVHLALEKRLNFTLEDLAVSSPPYRYFQRKLKELSEPDKMKPQLVVLRLPDDFPQHFNYERVPELELWRLTLIPKMDNKVEEA